MAGSQQYPSAALYVVATPIGNLADISLRALHLLSIADRIACEDTRVSAQLLQHFGLGRPLLALHEHNEAQAADRVLQALAAGERVAFVSDAGTPGISDPGARLVRAVRQAGYRVLPLPGASAVATAVSVAADVQAQGYLFAGFAPHKGEVRRAALQAWVRRPEAVVLFESPHRIRSLADDLAVLCPQRQLTVCRELTKQFETVHTLSATDLPTWLADDANRCRGEFVVVLHGLAAVPEDSQTLVDTLLGELVEVMPLKQAVALTVKVLGGSRNALYQRALALRADPPEG